MKKRLLVSVLALVLALGTLSGCGGGSKNEITVWVEAIGSEKAVLDNFETYFNENNDMGYTMKFKQVESVSKELTTSNLNGTSPDLVLWPRWETVTKSSLIKDLSAEIEKSENIKLTDFNDKARSELELGGKVYGIPTDLDAWGLWCNNDLMDGNEPPVTWAELTALTKTLTSGSGADTVVGLDAYNLRGQFYSFMLSAGATLVDTSGEIPKININTSNVSDKSYTDAASVVDLFAELMRATGTPAEYESDQKFIEGKVAMKFAPSNFNKTVELMSGSAMNLTFAGYPAKSESEGAVCGMLGGFSLAVPSIRSLERSFPVIEWWLSDENLTEYCRSYDLLAAKTTVQDADYVKDSQVLTALKEMLPACNVRPIAQGYSNVESSVIFAAMDGLREFLRDGKGTLKTTDDVLKYIKTKGDSQFELEFYL